MSDQTVRVLVFSDDADKRQAVINGVGLRASKDSPKIEWSEAATPFGVRELVENNEFAALILDGETQKQGGMSVLQDLRNTIDQLPPAILLIARQQDEWLANWSGAVAWITDPLDPLTLQETVASVLAGQR
ncbi:hypothetical protein G7Y41_05440 [Schaalia sp. ZJ405]|uniref:hypothetical protein n=1 Tax=Schaalia sp. ZJ405 TaxID=2709403 RepID=UPI0013ECC87B|nr:hypothetical protein [Schaalia sp. ZJ405]QPK80553.1 hypothetical protein G7Y41_05440 [Schaalia sp. ZJ405]